MTTPDLTTTAAVKSVLHITETTDDTLIDTFVSQASELFTTETRREFYSTSGATLTYDLMPPQVSNGQINFLTDVQGVDRVVNSGQVITPSEFRLLPLNNTPKYALQLLTGSNIWFQPDSQNNWQSAVEVHGTIGFCATGTIPSDVTYAVTKLAAYMYMTRDNDGSVIRFADGSSQIPADAPAVIMRTINNYKRVQIYV